MRTRCGTLIGGHGAVCLQGHIVRIGERSGMGISSLYGVWKKEKFAQPSIAESYEPDRTKVTVEYESETAEVGVEKLEVKEKTAEVKEKIEGEKSEFDILMGAYRNDFRDNARRVYLALANDSWMDAKRLSQSLGISESGIWRAVRAMKDVGLLVREGGDKGGRWIVKRAGK